MRVLFAVLAVCLMLPASITAAQDLSSTRSSELATATRELTSQERAALLRIHQTRVVMGWTESTTCSWARQTFDDTIGFYEMLYKQQGRKVTLEEMQQDPTALPLLAYVRRCMRENKGITIVQIQRSESLLRRYSLLTGQ